MDNMESSLPDEIDSGSGFEPQASKVIFAIAKKIYASVSFGRNKLKAVMNLPPISQVDNETLASALQFIMEKYFRLSFPDQEMMNVRAGRSVKFTEDSPLTNLPPRHVSILLSPEHRIFEIAGVDPEDGKDGYSELLFRWQKQSGLIDSLGNIDLKKLNTYPHVLADQPLANIFLRSEGTPGVNSLGKKIKQRPGQPLKIKFDEITVYQIRDPKKPDMYQLLARKGGIVDFLLTFKENPRSLAKIEILDTITINGDVDYRVGDQGSFLNKSLQCSSNIVVKGSVFGVFSLQSTGFVHIAGAFEGKKVAAEEVVAEVVTSGSSIYAKRDVVVANVIHARVEGNTVTLKKNANESELIGHDRVRLLQKANCLGLTITTPRLESSKNRFSGRNLIHLGIDLFGRQKEILANRKLAEEELASERPELKDTAAKIVNALTSLESHLRGAGFLQKGDVKNMMAVIKKLLVAAIQNMSEQLDENLLPVCNKLQSLLAAKKVHESVLRKLEGFVATLKQFNGQLIVQQKKKYTYQNTAAEFDKLKEEVRNIGISFEKPTFHGNNAEIRVICHDQELLIDNKSMPADTFTVRYALADSATDITGGKLVIRAENPASF